MVEEHPRILRLASSISDGTRVDWDNVEGAAIGEDLELIRGLREVEAIVEAHRRRNAAFDAAPVGAQQVLFRWGTLDVLEKIGEGSFGEVYRARDARLQRDVALKLYRTEARGDRVDSFVDEGRLLARVHHPNVVTVFGAERHDGRAGIWMELVRGRDLAEVLREQGLLGAREAGLVGLDLCQALAAVHRTGLIHGDLKASNVLRESGGRIVLMDFGAGRNLVNEADSAGGAVSGTPLYMAPEVLRGGRAGARSDIYSLGVLLYHLVTGSYPVVSETMRGLREEHERGACHPLAEIRPDLAPPFVRVVERALEIDPGRRYETAAAMEQALAAAIGVESTTEETRSSAANARTRWIAAVAAGVIVALTAVFWIALRQDENPGTPSRPSDPPSSHDAAASGGTAELPSTTLPGGHEAAADRLSDVRSKAAKGPPLTTYGIEAGFYRGRTAQQRLVSGDRVAVGDALSLRLEASLPVFVYVVNEDENGVAALLFPLPDTMPGNPVEAGFEHVLPGTRDGEQQYWQVTSPGEQEHFLIVVSPVRLAALERESADLSMPRHGETLYPTLPSTSTDELLRGVTGLVAGPRTPPGSRRIRLFDVAAPLGSGREQATGLWVRYIDLENPTP